MTDTRTVTGSRDDLVLDASRCLKMRFSKSSCRRCVDICPHSAVSVDGFLAINPNHCHGCLLCTAVCPSGALEQSTDFSSCLAQLSRVSEPLLGCIRTNGESNATLACLGGLSEEHLVTLCHSLPDMLTLNLSQCADCTNNAMIIHLRQRLTWLSEAGLFVGGCRIVLAESDAELHFRDESVDRRSFFKSLRRSLFQSAAAILSTTNEVSEHRAEYAGKRLPLRREILNRISNKLSPAMKNLLRKNFDSGASFNDNCTACQGCVAICPTGAIQTEQSDTLPVFDRLLCTGCGLCAEFCLESALRISHE